MVWSGLVWLARNPASLVAPELVWGLIPRFVGLLYVLAFGSLTFQLLRIIGSHGATPIAPRLEAARRDFPGVRRFFQFPTLFWWSARDGVIRVVPLLGVLCGLLACYGGPLGYAGLLFGWVLWLSIEPAWLIFPWDTMLQEVGFLVLFLPLANTLPSLETSALPLPTVAFMFRWLVLRLMLGFAKVKFIGTGKGDSMYLRGFLIWAPLPTPLGWWGHHAPRWLLKGSLSFMFVAEAVAPVLGFFTGAPRIVAFACLSMLMLGIQATGNWGYFNIGYALLCVCLLDADASLADLWREPWASHALAWPDLTVHIVMAILFLSSLIYFVVLNSWVTHAWVQWPWELLSWKRRWLRVLIGYFRALTPFHVVNGYGVFPPNAAPPLRFVPVIEGSRDGKTWKAYGYKFLPTKPHSRLQVFAPHHPRIDQTLHYVAMGIHDAGLFSHSIGGDGNPYLAYSPSCWVERTAQRLLDSDPQIKRALGEDPFPDAAPAFVRVSCYVLAPTRPSELRQSGERWRVRRMGTLARASGKKPWLEAQSVPVPELFHPDFLHYKRSAQPLRAMLESYREGAEPDRAVLVESDLSAEDVRVFWEELVPAVQEARGDWPRVHERAARIAAQFDGDQRYRLERLLGRYTWLLRAATEPHFAYEVAPKIEIASNFRFELLLQEIVCDGREAYLQTLRDPARAAERARTSDDTTQLWALTLFRYDVVMFHALTFRYCDIGALGHRFKFQGIFEFYPLLSSTVAPGEEFMPTVIKHDDGEFTVPGLYEPPYAAPIGTESWEG